VPRTIQRVVLDPWREEGRSGGAVLALLHGSHAIRMDVEQPCNKALSRQNKLRRHFSFSCFNQVCEAGNTE
jgi:hypothetical protein